MSPIVLSSLIPVVLLIAIGFIAGYEGYIRAEATKDLATLVFTVLTPALLFRTMSTVHVERLDFKPVAVYFAAAMLLFAAMLFWQGATRRAAVLALAATFSNRGHRHPAGRAGLWRGRAGDAVHVDFNARAHHAHAGQPLRVDQASPSVSSTQPPGGYRDQSREQD